MKKYYQTALVFTAALSLIALLFYRHEYNKLRFVLQVLNYFGTSAQNVDSNCTIIPLSVINNEYYDDEFTLPVSSWQRINDNLYIYSAYNNENSEIRAIGFGKNIDHSTYVCHVLFDNDIEWIVGKFSYELISNNDNKYSENDKSKYHGYLLKCNFNKINDKYIVGIKFINIARDKFDAIPIIHVNTLNHNVNMSDNVICIAPPTDGFMKHENIVSFLAFHHYIGWKNFIIYDFGISPVLSNNLKNIAKILYSQLNFTYSIIPWNFPYAHNTLDKTIRKIIETDCIYRTYNKAIMSITLSWNEYINLRYHNTVESVLSDIAIENKLINDKYRLRTLVYCFQNILNDTLNTMSKMLITTRRLKKIIDNDYHYIYKLENILNNNTTQQNIDDLIFINRYQQCNIDDKREIVDSEMLKFVEYVPNTKIFQYYFAEKLSGH